MLKLPNVILGCIHLKSQKNFPLGTNGAQSISIPLHVQKECCSTKKHTILNSRESKGMHAKSDACIHGKTACFTFAVLPIQISKGISKVFFSILENSS